MVDENDNFKSLRVNYLLKHFSRDQWKDQLYIQEKHRQKHLQYIQILQTFIAVSADWLRRMVLELPQGNLLKEQIDGIKKFVKYIDEQVNHLNKRYKSSLSSVPYQLIH